MQPRKKNSKMTRWKKKHIEEHVQQEIQISTTFILNHECENFDEDAQNNATTITIDT